MAEPAKIATLLARVMADVQAVRKDDRNAAQGYNFRGIDAVVNAVGPAFRAHGVICLPTVEDVSYAVVEVGQRRTPMRECTVRVRYTFHGPAGDSLECVAIGEAMDSGDKATPKAMSVAHRVALLQALCIPTDEPDADSQSYERASRQVDRRDPQRLAVIEHAIDAAEDESQLRQAFGLIGPAEDDGAISPDEARMLGSRVRERKTQLAPEQPTLPAPTDTPPTTNPPTDRQIKYMYRLFNELGITGADVHEFMTEALSDATTRRVITSSKQLSFEDADTVLVKLKDRKREVADATPTP
ncbi:MAG TPA: ERF family protein [Jiangellales bacterium]|nr:ERF family protein [Jiangellales bacterium]